MGLLSSTATVWKRCKTTAAWGTFSGLVYGAIQQGRNVLETATPKDAYNQALSKITYSSAIALGVFETPECFLTAVKLWPYLSCRERSAILIGGIAAVGSTIYSSIVYSNNDPTHIGVVGLTTLTGLTMFKQVVATIEQRHPEERQLLSPTSNR